MEESDNFEENLFENDIDQDQSSSIRTRLRPRVTSDKSRADNTSDVSDDDNRGGYGKCFCKKNL